MSWSRALNVGCRTGHLLSVAIVLGGAVFDVDATRLAPFVSAAVATGAALAALEIAASPAWPATVKGAMVLAKLGLLSTLLVFPDRRVPVLVSTLVVASVAAHMPSRFRHRRVIGTWGRPMSPTSVERARAAATETAAVVSHTRTSAGLDRDVTCA